MLGTQLTGMISQFDSDAPVVIQNIDVNTKVVDTEEGRNEHNMSILITNAPTIKDTENIDENKENQASYAVQDWGIYNPSMLRTPKSNKLNVSSSETDNAKSSGSCKNLSNKRFKKTSHDAWTEVGKAKLNLIEIQKQCFLEEHKLKMEKLKMEKEMLQHECEYKKMLYNKN